MNKHLSLSQRADRLGMFGFSTNISYPPAPGSRLYPSSILVLSFRIIRNSLEAIAKKNTLTRPQRVEQILCMAFASAGEVVLFKGTSIKVLEQVLENVRSC